MEKKELSDMNPLYDKKVQCPVCNHLFSSKKVRTRFIKSSRTDSDFGMLFARDDMNNPLFYYVMVCPQCGFSFSEDVKRPVPQTAKDRVKIEITDKMDNNIDYCGERDFSMAEKTFKLAIYSGQLIGEKHIAFARLCLRLAWLYRGIEKREEEMRFIKLAVSEFEQSYINSDFNPENTPEIYILYMIGELNRRLGNHNEALKYFASVTEHPDKSRNVKYVNMARNQWKLAVEEYKAKK